jgi:hypothetical protein
MRKELHLPIEVQYDNNKNNFLCIMSAINTILASKLKCQEKVKKADTYVKHAHSSETLNSHKRMEHGQVGSKIPAGVG